MMFFTGEKNDDGIFKFVEVLWYGSTPNLCSRETNEKLPHQGFVRQNFGIPSCQPRLFTFLFAGEVMVPKSIGAGDSGCTRVGRARAESSLPVLGTPGRHF